MWRSLNGTVKIQITSADPAGVICSLYGHGIPVENVHYVDELTFHCQVQRQYTKRVIALVDRRADQWKILSHKGIFWSFQRLINRPVLVAGVLIFILLTIFLPTRIYFFCVEGNASVPDQYILELASEYGISFGAVRREIRSEQVKNALLHAIPQLEWVGINTAGCVATISVRERQVAEPAQPVRGISSIVAIRDGVVQEVTVTGGSAACRPGQAVRAGQVLISGYTDCGLSIRAERAKGEIYATTNRQMMFILPENFVQRGHRVSQNQRFSIIIGKKRINFYQDSGNLDATCVKMYEENYVTLPGGFILPIAIVTETYIYYEDRESVAVGDLEDTELPQIAQSYLSSQMIAGRIVNADVNISRQEDAFLLSGKYECLEMIGQERLEEIITP